MVRTFVDIEELFGAATEVERVLGELGETPYEPLKEEQEEESSQIVITLFWPSVGVKPNTWKK